jgi:HEAT repeat protein
MVNQRLLDWVMLVEIALLVLAVAVFFSHGLWLYLNHRRVMRVTESARESLARLVTRGTINVEDIKLLRQLRHDVQVMVFLETSRNLTGSGKERLRFVAREIALLERGRKLCESRLWTRRLRGARLLSRMDVADPIVVNLLTDSNAAVRAQAAEWAATQPSESLIATMLTLLADPETQARFAVQDALLRMGTVVTQPLAAFLETHTGEPAESGLRVAAAIGSSEFLPAADRHSASDDVAVRVEATNLLGAIGDVASAERLTALLKDGDPRVRAAAAHGLGRMQHWQSGSHLAECLRDPNWQVRREAGLALRALGAPGSLFLRRALKGEDRFASDMAQQVLDLPEAAASG